MEALFTVGDMFNSMFAISCDINVDFQLLPLCFVNNMSNMSSLNIKHGFSLN